MQDLFTNPALQSSIAPLVISLIVALMLRKAGTLWQGLAIMSGLLIAVSLITGLNFLPLTSTRKIILSSFVVPFTALWFNRFSCPPYCRAAIFAGIMACLAVWIVWPVLGRQEVLDAWIMGARVAVFAAAVTGATMWFTRNDAALEGGVLLALGIGTGASTLIAASALYGQLAFAVTAAMGGLLLAVLFRSGKDITTSSLGQLSVFAAIVPLGLIGGAATVYAKLPSTALFFLVLVPVLATLPVARKRNLWTRVTLSTLLGLLVVVPAIWITWNSAGPIIY